MTLQGKKPGLGMYTVHQAVAQDMAGTFCTLAQMGYGGLEFYGEPSDFHLDRTKKALKDSGLRMTSWHIEWRNLQKATIQSTMEYLQEIGCNTAVVPCLGGKWNVAHSAAEECRDIWLRHIDWLNETAQILKQNGLRTGYHNHEHEFLLHYNGQRVFDLLFTSLAPEIVMEFDTGNCIEGGEDPCAVLDRYKERAVLLHLKPYSPEKGFDVVLGDADDTNDWTRILSVPGTHIEELLLESECAVLPEMENARLCLKGIERIASTLR